MTFNKAILASVPFEAVHTWTDYNIDEDYIPTPIEYLDINYMRLFLDDTYYTDYSVIYRGHRTFNIGGKKIYIEVRAEQGDFDNDYFIAMKVYK